jgi:extradiol dioxygenase family protein
MAASVFHLSVPVPDLARARAFYGALLGCPEGRSGPDRVDFDFFGHHLVAHVEPVEAAHVTRSVVSAGVPTPVRHFGAILDRPRWDALADRLRDGGARFVLPPQVIFEAEVREQAILLVEDGCGNVVELKSQPPERIFARTSDAESAGVTRA